MATTGTFQADAMTAQPAKTIHAGVNAVVSEWSWTSAFSATSNVQLCPVPAGAQMTGFTLSQGNSSNNRAVKAELTIGGTSVWEPLGTGVGSTAVAGVYVQNAGTGTTPLGKRVTASAVMTIQIDGSDGTGTSAGTFRAVTEYIYEKRGD